MEDIENFLMDLDAIVHEHNMKVDITLQFGAENRVKPTGNLVYSAFIRSSLKNICGCGCKLRTDGDLVWCSGITCDFLKEA